MNDHSSTPSRVITCKNTADFLAALPQLTGFTAENSLFVVCFSGKQAGRVLRIDLPRHENPQETVGVLDFISRVLHDFGADEASSAPAIVISSAQSFAETGGPPWEKLARRIERRLRRERIGVRELCCVAPDGWIGFLDPAAPRRGRPLSEIAESPVAIEARERGETPPDLGSLGAIPEPDSGRAAAVARALGTRPPYDLPDPVCGPPPHPGSVEDAYRWFAETAQVVHELRREGEAMSPETTARLIRSAVHSDRWLLIAMGVLTRPEFPGELARETDPARFTGVPVDIDVDPAKAPKAGWSIRRILANISPDFTDQDRLPNIRRRLLTAISETPEELRPALLALSGWIWWLSGNQTVAHRHARAALEAEPEHELALMVERLIAAPLYERMLARPHARVA